MRSKSMAVAGHDPGRAAIRALLLLLAGLLAATLALPAGPLSGIAAAQEEPEEEEQEAPEGPAIKFLNPSDYGKSRVASIRDMEDHGYHLVAWVHDVPPDPRVLFEAESASAGRRRLGLATPEGSGTFGLHWHIPPSSEFATGTYTLRAILFSGSNQVAADETTVNVQPNNPTVRINNPTSGGRMGVYQPPGGNAPWNTIIDYTFSSGLEGITFFYTLTQPGLEPEWHECGTAFVSPIGPPREAGGGTPDPGSRRHLCQFGEDHDGREVTAVAAVAHDEPFPMGREEQVNRDRGGDAHGVAPYRQLPIDVSLSVQGPEPGVEGPRQYEAGGCTNQFLVFVRDQLQRPVARANVDVHATGPEATEGRAALRFDSSTGGSGTDARTPPDQNHQDETSAWNCVGLPLLGPGPGGTQGNHRNPFGPDTRHIESVAAGTSVDGRFRFRLYNDQPGGTQITAWADADDDDLYCALEGAAHTSIGWNQAPPAVEGHQPEQSSCEIPGLDEVLGEQITRHARTIGINFRQAGGRLEVRGRVGTRTGFAPCARNVPVRVQRRAGNQWQTLATVNTNGQRLYRARVANRSGVYRVLAPRIFKGSQSDQLCQRTAARKQR